MRLIKCSPLGGIGNRWLTLTSTLRIAEIIGYKFKVFWLHQNTDSHVGSELSANPLRYFDLPFEVDLVDERLKHPLTPSFSGRSFFRKEDLLALEEFAIVGHNEKGTFYHCLWLEDDLYELNQLKLESLTRDISQIIKRTTVPTNHLNTLMVDFPSTFDLGIHYRAPVKDDFERGHDNTWPTLPIDWLVFGAVDVLRSIGARTCFISSNDQAVSSELCDHLSTRGISCFVPRIEDGSINEFSHDDLAYTSFSGLLRCKAIMRRSNTTFSALAALANADLEFLVSDNLQISKRRPLLFTGGAL